MMDDDLQPDPERQSLPASGIYVRAKLDDGYGTCDIAHLDPDSIVTYLVSLDKGALERLAMHLLGYPPQ